MLERQAIRNLSYRIPVYLGHKEIKEESQPLLWGQFLSKSVWLIFCRGTHMASLVSSVVLGVVQNNGANRPCSPHVIVDGPMEH